MIKHILLIIDSLDLETEQDICETLSAMPNMNEKTDILVFDTVQSAMTTMQVMTVKGSLN